MKERERVNGEPPLPERPEESPPPAAPPRLSRPLRAVRGTAVSLLLATVVVHLLLVFLHVAPANPVSQRFSRQINAWVYPLFEQNWRLFAPDPESANQRIYARTAHTAPDGTMVVSTWFELIAQDTSAVAHDPFPSHTAQNMLRRAWTSYVDTHGGDDQPHSDRAVMMQRYLRNIAVQRFSAHQDGPIQSVQLQVVDLPIAASGAPPVPAASTAASVAAHTRYLPWWKVTSDDH